MHAVIDAAATKPFGFQPFYPGAGVGPHCIPVDPMYLAHAGRELGVPLRLVELALQINDERPRQVAGQCTRLLASAGKDVAGSNVLILGISYKPDVADVRNSPTVPLIRALTDRGIMVTVHDVPARGAAAAHGRPAGHAEDQAGWRQAAGSATSRELAGRERTLRTELVAFRVAHHHPGNFALTIVDRAASLRRRRDHYRAWCAEGQQTVTFGP